MLMPYNDEQWNEEEIIDSPALLIQNGNNSTIPLLLASELPQNEITLASDPLRRSSIQLLMSVQVQQSSLTALTTSEVEEDENTLMPYNDEQWNEEEIIDSPALLIQNGNNSTIPLLLASELPQNEITLAPDPLRRSSIQPLTPVQVQQSFLTALTIFFSENTLMPYNEEWYEEEIIDTDNEEENTLMYTKTGNDGLIDLTGNNGLISLTFNALDG